MSAPERVWDFPGGLHLAEHKAESIGRPIQQAPVPPQLIFPLQQHIGSPANPCVSVGERVLKGQVIAEAVGYVSAPIHASSSGTVVAIEERPVPHPSGLSAACIVIDTDGQDEALGQPQWPPVEDFSSLDANSIRERVRQAGLAGLGGAAFPSFIKLNPGRPIDTLVLNGAECEPYISCDQMLMAERAEQIVAGAQVILHAINAPRCLIGVEDNKPNAIKALRAAALVDSRIRISVVPTRYPQGGEKQLIRALTGREVPSEGLPLDIGIVCHNVGTAVAVWRAITQAQPLISRVVTVTGAGVNQPGNFEVRLGTPAEFLIDLAGGLSADVPARLIMGGPMMGFALSSQAIPVVKATNCLLVASHEEVKPEPAAMPCIRCGSCVEVCPAQLLPQQLYWHARAREFDKAQEHALFDCIECGCCAQVCPSQIPLVQYYRYAKTEIWAEEREKRKADAARERHDARQLRLEREAAEREAARQQKKAAMAAAKRAREQQPQSEPTTKPESQPAPANDPVAAAIAAARQKKAARAAESASTDTAADPVAAAIAAAKARKAEKAEAAQQSGAADSTADDPVARAIAAAKARKASKADEAPEQTDAGDDPVAQAIAAAKARKAAKAESAASADVAQKDADDPVAKAIAAAKARKAARDAKPEEPQ